MENIEKKILNKLLTQRNFIIAIIFILIAGVLFGSISIIYVWQTEVDRNNDNKNYRLELVSLQEAINGTKNELAEIEEVNDSLSEKYKGLKDQCFLLINQIDTVLINFDKLKESEVSKNIDHFNNKMRGFRARYDELSREVTVVQTQVFGNIQIAYWKKLYYESENDNIILNAENRKLQTKINDLNTKLIAATKELVSLQVRLAKTRAERDKYKAEWQEASVRKTKDVGALAKLVKRKEEELQQQYGETKKLIAASEQMLRDLDEINSQLNSSRNSSIEKQKDIIYKMAQHSLKCTYTFKESNDKREQKRLLDNSNSHYSKFVEKIHIHFLVSDRHLQDCNSKKIFVKLFDANNKLIKQKGVTLSGGQVDFDMETPNLEVGNYFVRVGCDEKIILPQYSFKISKKLLF